ncbi:RICIN domain-containing protein [Streptomyces orinoci]|uniref:RICIN domain-containing protein n=1 Tax=Streptomyces orinoci TaxID=67339 RepID=A0ABV3JRR5_STRON|nr:RICIN domain-containing protein [Streptomyces orinoci]
MKLLSSRKLHSAAIVTATAAITSALMAGPAHADIFLPSVHIQAKHGKRCLTEHGEEKRLYLDGCSNSPWQKWEVASYNGDTNGIHNVRVYNLASKKCLTVDSGKASIEGCKPGQVRSQIWALTGNNYRSFNYQFYTYDIHACLDSGQSSSLLLRQNGCNTKNDYQYWGLPNA